MLKGPAARGAWLASRAGLQCSIRDVARPEFCLRWITELCVCAQVIYIRCRAYVDAKVHRSMCTTLLFTHTVHTSAHMYIYNVRYVYNKYSCKRMYVCMYVRMYVCMHVMYVCMYVCVYVCRYVH